MLDRIRRAVHHHAHFVHISLNCDAVTTAASMRRGSLGTRDGVAGCDGWDWSVIHRTTAGESASLEQPLDDRLERGAAQTPNREEPEGGPAQAHGE